MQEIARRYPTLRFDHVRELATVIAVERNAAAAINTVYSKATWGLACLYCQLVRQRIFTLWNQGVHEWLEFIPEPGMAYTVLVGGVPLRVQPDSDEVRDVMPGERVAMMAQTTLFADPQNSPTTILRLEVSQPGGASVDRITLHLINEVTKETLDTAIIYATDGSKTVFDDTALLSLTRGPQAADTKDIFTFHADTESIKNDNDGGK